MSDIYREVFLPTGEKVVLQGDAVWVSPYRRGPDGVDHLRGNMGEPDSYFRDST